MHKGCENVDRRWIQSCYFSRAFSGSLMLTAGGILFLFEAFKSWINYITNSFTLSPDGSSTLILLYSQTSSLNILSHHTSQWSLCHGLDTSHTLSTYPRSTFQEAVQVQSVAQSLPWRTAAGLQKCLCLNSLSLHCMPEEGPVIRCLTEENFSS